MESRKKIRIEHFFLDSRGQSEWGFNGLCDGQGASAVAGRSVPAKKQAHHCRSPWSDAEGAQKGGGGTARGNCCGKCCMQKRCYKKNGCAEVLFAVHCQLVLFVVIAGKYRLSKSRDNVTRGESMNTWSLEWLFSAG